MLYKLVILAITGASVLLGLFILGCIIVRMYQIIVPVMFKAVFGRFRMKKGVKTDE